ncbi:MAG: hypothetical protein JWR09_5479 [Mucilaginibacter sp.]|nr:hypothetical protein [Mucilaginibacter sp.]
MRKLFILSALLFPALVFAQRSIKLTSNSVHSHFLEKRKTIDSAFTIASALLSSEEFQSIYTNLDFPYWNHCKVGECSADKNHTGPETTTGKEVMNLLFKEANVVMTIDLKKRSRHALGATCPGNYFTTAYYENILKDMPHLPYAYAIAVNLCHEYMHQVGLCHYSNSFQEPDDEHPDPEGFKNDVAYNVGWNAYYIATKWYVNHKVIPGL